MLSGPNLQQDLQSLLIRWRQYRIAFTADIEKMFRFIYVHENDQIFQKLIWRDSPEQPIKEYQLCTVTYGTKAAPFLAMKTLKQLAEDERQNYSSEAIKALEHSFYMDDILHGCHSIKSALLLKQELIQLLKSGGFNLRKWSCNTPELLLQDEVGKEINQDNFDFKQVQSTKTLGLRWDPTTDLFVFQSKIEPSNNPPTKRSMLSDISKLFDPLGWLSPLSISLKLMFQKVWTSKIQWDEQLPADIGKDWKNMRDSMHKINQFKVKRWLGSSECCQMELHGFSDASLNAYSCVIYCKQVINGDVLISLVAGKTRLVPVNKSISLPRIELSGALLLSKLMHKIQQCLTNHTIKMYGWTDSMVVLAWLQGDPGRWKPFVSNRVRQITEVLPPNSWRYVKSAENPADCASRGITVDQLMGHTLWWTGPSWLSTFNIENNQEKFTTQEEQKQLKQANTAIQSSHTSIIGDLLTRYSSFTKLTRVLAWVFRFIKLIKYKQSNKHGYLTLQEIKYAECIIIKYVQQLQFTQEVECLHNKLSIPSKSKLLLLNPYLDDVGILRVGGRLSKARISQDMKHPIIIPHEGHLTNLIIDCAHVLTLHGGARVTAATIRLKYWIIGGYRAVKKRIRTCIICRKHSPSKMTQLMGDLPPQRCNVAKPFYHTGVDYTGHVFIKANKGRGIKTTKGYISVFVCMATKLIHLELVSDLTSSAFLAALRRMAARKGSPKHLYSDNGTNFIGANKILQEEFAQIQKTFDQDLMDEITNMKIQWHFNAPSFPSGGGLWESAVKSVKFHLRRVIGEQRLTFEEYSTVLAQVEAVLNSRPLCPLTEDPNDLEFITPSSFVNISQDMSLLETETDMRTRWHMTQKIVQDVWKRWRAEYLSHLSARCKWRSLQENIKINDLVTIHDANLPPGKWVIGRVVQLHPGADGHVRVVTLKTISGLIKRPIVKLSVLPVNDRINNQESHHSQPINNTQRPQRSSKRSCYSLISLAMLFLSFMSIISTVHCNYNVTILKENQGLYFDKISNMQLIRDEWKIVTYYDMNPYWHGNAASSKYIDYLKQLCNKLTDVSHCDTIQIQLQQEYSELDYYNNMLLSQHSSTRPIRRQRRGLIDGVGYLANSLFGVLDERFAAQYKQDIQLIQHNENHLLALMKNQTSVIEAEYNVLKRNEISINKQHKILNMLSIRLGNLENTVKNESLRMEVMSDFSLAAIVTSNLLRHLKTIQNTLLNTITDVYHGRLNFQLLSPEQLKETLNTISSHLSKDLSLPVNDLQENFRNIYYLLKIKARMSKEYLIFELKLPLITRESYEIMKIIPIPQVIENKFMATIVPIADHVAINLKQDSYIPMSIHDVESCLVDSSATYLCHTRNPVYHLTSDEKLCERDFNTERCKTTITSCSNQWIETNKLNKYLFLCCNQCYVRILCENNVSTARLKNAGIFGVEHGCIIKTDNFTVHSHSRYSSNMNVKDELRVPDMEPINHMINVGMPISQIQNDSTSNSKELEEIKKQLRSLKENENLAQQVSFHDIHHYVAFYVVVGAAFITCAVLVVRRVRGKRAARQALARDAVASYRVAQASVSIAEAEAATPGSSSIDQTLSVVQCNQSEKCVNPKVFVDKCTTPIPRKTKFNQGL